MILVNFYCNTQGMISIKDKTFPCYIYEPYDHKSILVILNVSILCFPLDTPHIIPKLSLLEMCNRDPLLHAISTNNLPSLRSLFETEDRRLLS